MGRAGADLAGAARRLHPVGHHRHHRRRPHRLRAVLQSRLLHPAPGRDLRVVEGRHVVPRRLPRLRRGGDAVCPQERHLDPVARRHHHRGRRRSGCCSGGIANFINSELWGRPADSSVPWAMVFPNGGPLPRHPSQLYEAGARGHPAVYGAGGHDPDGRPEAAGPDPRQLHRDLRPCAHHRRILPRARSAARLFVGRTDHGYAAVGADDHCRSHPDRDGMAPRDA